MTIGVKKLEELLPRFDSWASKTKRARLSTEAISTFLIREGFAESYARKTALKYLEAWDRVKLDVSGWWIILKASEYRTAEDEKHD